MEPFCIQTGNETHMPVNLSIKGVPEALAERLRARAEHNHRSLQGELMAIVEAAAEPIAIVAQPPAASRQVSGGTRVGFRTVEETWADLLAQFPEPVRGGPLAVDIVREDRDSR